MKDVLDFKSGSYSKEITRDFFKSVYTYMFAALAVSGFIAYVAGTPEFFSKYFVTEQGTLSPLIYVAMFAPVGLGILIQMAYQRLSLGLLIILFMMYSVLMGVSLSTIMLVYSIGAIASTFFITAGAFAAMAILGYTTKVDLTKFGSLMYMLFIGIFIAGIVNIFMQSEMMQFVISFIGVFVFTGLTAYYMQQLKTTAQNEALSEIDRNKLSLVGGLMLYILFINLFMSLLSLLGGRD